MSNSSSLSAISSGQRRRLEALDDDDDVDHFGHCNEGQDGALVVGTRDPADLREFDDDSLWGGSACGSESPSLQIDTRKRSHPALDEHSGDGKRQKLISELSEWVCDRNGIYTYELSVATTAELWDIGLVIHVKLRILICILCRSGQGSVSHWTKQHGVKGGTNLDAVLQHFGISLVQESPPGFEPVRIPFLQVFEGGRCKDCNKVFQTRPIKHDSNHTVDECLVQTIFSGPKRKLYAIPEVSFPRRDDSDSVTQGVSAFLAGAKPVEVFGAPLDEGARQATLLEKVLGLGGLIPEGFDRDVLGSLCVLKRIDEADELTDETKERFEDLLQHLYTDFNGELEGAGAELRRRLQDPFPAQQPASFMATIQLATRKRYAGLFLQLLVGLRRLSILPRFHALFTPSEEVAAAVAQLFGVVSAVEREGVDRAAPFRASLFAVCNLLFCQIITVLGKPRELALIRIVLLSFYNTKGVLFPAGEHMTHPIVALQYAMRLYAFYRLYQAEEREWSDVFRFLQRTGVVTPFSILCDMKAQVSSLQASIAKEVECRFGLTADGSINHNEIYAAGCTFHISNFQSAYECGIDMLRQHLTHLSGGYSLERYDLKRIQDNLSNNTPGISLFTLVENDRIFQLERTFEAVGHHLFSKGFQFSADSDSWGEREHRYMKVAEEFVEKLLFLFHISGGQPLRGSEYAQISLVNERDGMMRSILFMYECLVFRTTYSKTSNKSGSEKHNLHFLPPALTEVLLSYLVVVRPFVNYVSSIYYSQRDNVEHLMRHKLFCKRGTLLDSGRAETILKAQIGEAFGNDAGIKEYRQMMVMLGEHAILGYNDADQSMELMQNVLHYQSGHSGQVVNQFYGISPTVMHGVSRELMWTMYCASVCHHRALGMRPMPPNALLDPRLSGPSECGSSRRSSLLSSNEGSSTNTTAIFAAPRDSELKRAPLAPRLYPAPIFNHHAKASSGEPRTSGLEAVVALNAVMIPSAGRLSTFKSPGQALATRHALDGCDDLIITLEMGGGKSYIYMVEARQSKKVVVVVPTLGALLSDTLHRLKKAKMRFLEWKGNMVNPCVDDLEVVVVSVERFVMDPFQNFMKDLFARGRLRTVVIDEVQEMIHAQSYRHVFEKVSKMRTYKFRWMLLSATLTDYNRHYLASKFKADFVWIDGEERLGDLGMKCTSKNGKSAVLDYVCGRVSKDDKVVILCPTVQMTKQVHSRLSGKEELQGRMWHSDMEESEKRDAISFLTEEEGNRYLVGTPCVGVGIDFPQVQLVIIVGYLYSNVQYCQAFGRVGRGGDGQRCGNVEFVTCSAMLEDGRGCLSGADSLNDRELEYSLTFMSDIVRGACIRASLAASVTPNRPYGCFDVAAKIPCSSCVDALRGQGIIAHVSTSPVVRQLPAHLAYSQPVPMYARDPVERRGDMPDRLDPYSLEGHAQTRGMNEQRQGVAQPQQLQAMRASGIEASPSNYSVNSRRNSNSAVHSARECQGVDGHSSQGVEQGEGHAHGRNSFVMPAAATSYPDQERNRIGTYGSVDSFQARGRLNKVHAASRRQGQEPVALLPDRSARFFPGTNGMDRRNNTTPGRRVDRDGAALPSGWNIASSATANTLTLQMEQSKVARLSQLVQELLKGGEGVCICCEAEDNAVSHGARTDCSGRCFKCGESHSYNRCEVGRVEVPVGFCFNCLLPAQVTFHPGGKLGKDCNSGFKKSLYYFAVVFGPGARQVTLSEFMIWMVKIDCGLLNLHHFLLEMDERAYFERLK